MPQRLPRDNWEEVLSQESVDESAYTSVNVAQFLLGGKHNDALALTTLDREYSYGDVDVASTYVGALLVGKGGLKGDRVILACENSFFWVVCYLGILRVGLVCVPIPMGIPQPELQSIVDITGPRFAFLQSAFFSKNAVQFHGISVLTDTMSLNGSAVNRAEVQGRMNQDARATPQASGHDLAALMFTSGSTGEPRGVMISHANIVANTRSIIRSLAITEKDRMMTVLPFHYCFGTSLLHTHLQVGASLVVDQRFMYPDKVLQRMRETECTGFAGVPSHYQILLRRSSLREMDFPHLRSLQQAGGHLAPARIRELRDALPGKRIFIMYGQTEATARLSCLAPELLDQKIGSIGKGICGVRLRVVSEKGVEVLAGEVGEIVADGPNIALGYWRDPQESAVSFRNGRLHTGDLGTADEDGFIYLVERAKDFVKCGGRRIGCRELEQKLLEFGELAEAAVIGMPDDILGEAIKVFAVPCEGCSTAFEERLRKFCRERMPPQFNPKAVVLLDALPKNAAGKVLKSRLRSI